MVSIWMSGDWLDTDKETKLQLKWTNNIIERGTPELLHSIDLTIPYTELKDINYILDSMFNDYRK